MPICFFPLEVVGRGEPFGFRTSRKKDSKGPEKKGWQRDVPRGEVALEGQTRGRWSITGEHEGRGERERCPSPS